MSKNAAIDIFLRVRPTKKAFNGLQLLQEDGKVEFHVPKDQTQGYVNNQKEDYKFKFNGMFGMETKQEQIFENIAKDVVDSAFDGYNGTVFAYGQTGSGKTYTMTGGVEKYNDRGIIPRTLSYIFKEARNRTDTFYKISVSYIEIYNNEGYDLLDENHTTKNLSDLSKVIPREKEDGTLVLSGLSVHKAENEEQALNLLFIGDTNRVVSETPKNDASTRSHCIFIIQIEGEQAGSEGKKTVARVYLVDLSGSESKVLNISCVLSVIGVGKTEVDGLLLKEARYINLSLHHLEHVIVNLTKKARGENIHIPYRNSLMTLILRDSLGGNCKTRMIATISAEKGDIDESICTCRFAQRVALIQNNLLKNEAIDPALIIEKLKKENQALKAEIAFLKGGEQKQSLTQEDVEECRRIVEDFVTNPDPGARIILKDMLMINECFYLFKHRLNDLGKRYDKHAAGSATKKVLQDGLDMKGDNNKLVNSEQYSNMQDEIKRLKMLVSQRDNEIVILLNMIQKSKNAGNNESILVPVSSSAAANTSVIMGDQESQQYRKITFHDENEALTKKIEQNRYPKLLPDMSPQKQNGHEVTKPLDIVQTKLRGEEMSYANTSTMNQTLALTRADLENMLVSPLNLTNEQLKDRAACFELFRKSYRKNQALEENKEVLKEKMLKAKQVGAVINNARGQIPELKRQIEELRKDRARQGLEDVRHPDEDKIVNEIDKQKQIYKVNFELLKDLKAEIENIQAMMERSHQKMQKDFEKWLDVILNQSTVMPMAPQSQYAGTAKNTLQESQKSNLNMSGLSSASKSKTSNIDPAVEKNLEAFYKARDEIYKNTQGM